MSTATAAEILIYGSIGKSQDEPNAITAREFAEDMKYLREEPTIAIRINSGGGSVPEGIAIHAEIMRARQRGQRVDTYCDGAAFSMAGIIFQAGTQRVIGDHALLMVHSPLTGSGGNAKQLRTDIEALERVQAQLIDIIATRSKQPRATVEKWFDGAEHWFDAREAIAFGLADKRYTDANAHSATANRIFADYKIPSRYTVSRRGPIEEAISDLELTARIARGTRYYNSFKHLGNQAANAAERITKMPALEGNDLARVSAALHSISETQDWVREIY